MKETNNHKPQQNNRIRLPFEKRHTDWVTWCYMHRHGLLTTVIVFLLCAIIFVSTKINVHGEHPFDAILVDMEQPLPKEKLEEEMKKMLDRTDFDNIKNAVSNENAKEMTPQEARKVMQEMQADKLMDEGDNVLKKTASNRDSYERGLREAQQILNSKDKNKDNAKPQDSKVKGNVTVSFSFINPIRSSYKLVVPAYMCEGGGEVVVNATLNHNGSVIAASVDKSQSTTDECMVNTALRAARSSRFNVDSSAPQRHQGTISYIFIPQ